MLLAELRQRGPHVAGGRQAPPRTHREALRAFKQAHNPGCSCRRASSVL